MRNAVRKLRTMTDKTEATAFLPKVQTMLDKLAKNNIIHKNKAANIKSSVTLHVNSLSWFLSARKHIAELRKEVRFFVFIVRHRLLNLRWNRPFCTFLLAFALFLCVSLLFPLNFHTKQSPSAFLLIEIFGIVDLCSMSDSANGRVLRRLLLRHNHLFPSSSYSYSVSPRLSVRVTRKKLMLFPILSKIFCFRRIVLRPISGGV